MLNCELEHVDYYKSQEDYIAAYRELVTKIPEDGFLIYNEDDENCKLISEICQGKKIPVSAASSEKLSLNVPGDFNQLNAAHAMKAVKKISDNTELARKGLESFTGTARRMETKGEKEAVLVMDDYGHHPTEVRATLKALKEAHSCRRLICVFQPHQYSRTHELLEHFATAFEKADLVIIPNIFEARDTAEDKARVSAEKLVEAISQHHIDCRWGKDFETTTAMLKQEAHGNELIITMGAGDVYKIGEMYLKD